MKRIVVFSAIILCFLVASLVALPLFVSTQSLIEQLNSQMADLSAGKFSYKGQPHLSFIPYPEIELDEVVLAGEKQFNDEPDLLHIEKMRVGLNLLPLLFGKTEISRFKLTRPTFNLVIRNDGSANWARHQRLSESSQSSAQPLAETNNTEQDTLSTEAELIPDFQLGQFEIIDGIVEVTNVKTATTIRVSNLYSIIKWPTLHSAWDISGRGVWRGEVFSFSNAVDKPIALFTSGKSALDFQLKSAALAVSFDGHATMVSDIQLQGQTKISTPSLPRLFELLLGKDAVSIPPIGSFLVEGSMSANTHDIRFDGTEIELDANNASGNLQLNWNEEKRPKVSGTLAFSALDLTPLFDKISRDNSTGKVENNQSQKPMPFDLDIRFSAQNYQINQHSYGALAATAIVNGDQWVFDIGEADFFGGMLVATFASKSEDNIKEIELKGNLQKIAMGDITKDWYGAEIIAIGDADVNFSLRVPVEASAVNLSKFEGHMDIALTDGQIVGVDLTKAISALKQSNGFVRADEIKGETPFSNLSLELFIYNSVGWITKGMANGEKTEFRLSGKADLLRGGLAIYADIRQADDDLKSPPHATIFIGGTVKNPLVTHSPITIDSMQ